MQKRLRWRIKKGDAAKRETSSAENKEVRRATNQLVRPRAELHISLLNAGWTQLPVTRIRQMRATCTWYVCAERQLRDHRSVHLAHQKKLEID